ncbi:hypothetical protein EB001_09465 [bacterium]|nr:hypothetical protein [bacterium]
MSVKRLVPLHAVALESDPSTGRIGDIYYNTTDEELRYFDGTDWNPVGSGAITGLLDHIHTYDGAVFSVEATEVPAAGTIDGGTA